MMPSPIEQLAERRRALQMRCELQRQHVALLTAEIEHKFRSADRVLAVVSVVKNPVVIGAALAGVMFAGPWPMMRWIGKAALLFGLARKIGRLLGK